MMIGLNRRSGEMYFRICERCLKRFEKEIKLNNVSEEVIDIVPYYNCKLWVTHDFEKDINEELDKIKYEGWGMEYTIDCAETSYDVYHYDNVLKKYWINKEERIIKLKSLEDLDQLQKEINEDLIIGKNNSILIYDSYIE